MPGRAIMPKLGPQHYRSFSWRQPLSTHWRTVTCAEYGCRAFTGGWTTVVDTSTDLGKRQYDYITHDRSREHHEEQTGAGLVSFTFPPGQEFFAGSPQHEHRRPAGYAPVLLAADGDWRGNPRGTPVRVHRTAEDWVSDFGEHLERLARAQS